MNGRHWLWIGVLVCCVAIASAPWHSEPSVRRATALTAVALILWISEVAPLGVVALAIPLLAGLSGVLTWADALAAWGNPIVFLFLGAFLLARALEKHRIFDGLLASAALRRAAQSPIALSGAVLLLAGTLSTIQNNTAVAALLLPLVTPLARGCGATAAPLLALTYGATFGGLATPVGTAPNFMGYAQIKQLDPQMNFVAWLGFGLPAWLGTTVIGWAVLLLFSRASRARSLPATVATPAHLSTHAALDDPPETTPFARRAAIAAFTMTALVWLGTGVVLSATSVGDTIATLGTALSAPPWLLKSLDPIADVQIHAWIRAYLPEFLPPLAASVLLFFLRIRPAGPAVLQRRDFLAIDWDTLFLIAGGLCLGAALEKSGAGRALAEALGQLNWPATATFLAVGAVTVLLSELTSNTATAALLIPLAASLGPATGIDPAQLVCLVALAASLGFALPISTPPNAIVYGTGLVPLRTMIVAGVVVDVLSLLWLVLCVRYLY